LGKWGGNASIWQFRQFLFKEYRSKWSIPSVFAVRIKHLKTIILHGVTGMYNQNECLSIRWGEGKKGADDCPMVQGNHPRGTSVCGKIPDGG